MRAIESLRILYIDDMATIRNVLKKIFDELHVSDIESAADGADAWHKIKVASAYNKHYDLILCDWNLPELDGIDLVGMLRIHPDPKVRDVRFIMITGSDGKIRQAIDSGVDSFIAKPFTAKELKKRLEFLFRFDPSEVKAAA